MRRRAYVALIALAVAFPVISRGQEFNLSPTFGGRAVALQALETDGGSIALADTDAVPSIGGRREASMTDVVPFPGILARQLYAVTSGFGNKSHAQASLAGWDASLGNHRVTALWTEAQATAEGEYFNVLTSGSVTVNDLTIDGNRVAVSGAANQKIDLRDGYVIVNEQTAANSREFGSITVNAVHFVVYGVGGIVAASATAEVINQPTRSPAMR